MKRMKIRRVLIASVIAAGVTLGVGQARAALNYYTVTGAGTEGDWVQIDGNVEYVNAGALLLTPALPTHGLPFNTVCLDILATVYTGATYSFDPPKTFSGNTGLDPTWGVGNAGGVVNPNNARAGIMAAADLFYRYSPT